jgi:hypothetical protein
MKIFPDPFSDGQKFGRTELLLLLTRYIREALGGPAWENTTVEAYTDAMGAWLGSQSSPPRDSLERRMVGHILFPPGRFSTLPEYFAAVQRRVEAPEDGWPQGVAVPEPDWRLMGKALRIGPAYE